MRYDRAVGKQVQLGYMPLRPMGRMKPPPPRIRSWTDNFWNAGINVAYRGSAGDTDRKPVKRKRSWLFGAEPVGVEAFNRAQTEMQYGNVGAAHAQLGDLFNDIMGAVVPGWDQRPEALKKIVVKPDPNKLIQMANRVAPNAAGKIINAAEANGLNVMVQTPFGLMPMNEAVAQGLYTNAGILTQARDMFSSVPGWVWLAGAGGLVLVLGMSRK